MEFLLVDGYNIINAWSDLFDLRNLEDSREKFMAILSNYQGYKKTDIIIVFDAHLVKGGVEKEENYDNLTVIYTKESESADVYIERFVYRMAKAHRVRVATSDYLEQRMILSGGGIRMSPRELWEEIHCTQRQENEKSVGKLKKLMKTNTIMNNITPQLLEKLEKMRRGNM